MTDDLIQLLKSEEFTPVPLLVVSVGKEGDFSSQVKTALKDILPTVGAARQAVRFCTPDTFQAAVTELQSPGFEREQGITLQTAVPWWMFVIGDSALLAHCSDLSINQGRQGLERFAIFTHATNVVGGNDVPTGYRFSFALDPDAHTYFQQDDRLAKAVAAYLVSVWTRWCRDFYKNPLKDAWALGPFHADRVFTLALVEEHPDLHYHSARMGDALLHDTLAEWVMPIAVDKVADAPLEDEDILQRTLPTSHVSLKSLLESEASLQSTPVVAAPSSHWIVNFIHQISFQAIRAKGTVEKLYHLRELRDLLRGAERDTFQRHVARQVEKLSDELQEWRERCHKGPPDVRGFLSQLRGRSNAVQNWLKTVPQWRLIPVSEQQTFEKNEERVKARALLVPSLAAGLLRLLMLWIAFGWLAYYGYQSRTALMIPNGLAWGLLGLGFLLTTGFALHALLSRLFRERAFEITLRDLENQHLSAVLETLLTQWTTRCRRHLAEEERWETALQTLEAACEQMKAKPVVLPVNLILDYDDKLSDQLYLRYASDLKTRLHTAWLQDPVLHEHPPGEVWVKALAAHSSQQAHQFLTELPFAEIENLIELTDSKRAKMLEGLHHSCTKVAWTGPVSSTVSRLLLANELWDNDTVRGRFDLVEVRALNSNRIRLLAIKPLELPQPSQTGTTL